MYSSNTIPITFKKIDWMFFISIQVKGIDTYQMFKFKDSNNFQYFEGFYWFKFVGK